MVRAMIFGFFGWEIWTSFQDVPFALEIFRLGKPKKTYHLHPNRNFRNVLVNNPHKKNSSSTSRV